MTKHFSINYKHNIDENSPKTSHINLIDRWNVRIESQVGELRTIREQR